MILEAVLAPDRGRLMACSILVAAGERLLVGERPDKRRRDEDESAADVLYLSSSGT